MTKHTPGPWYLVEYGGETICSSDYEEEVAVVIRVYESDAEFEANARLIAAAPDMLKVLENIKSLIQDPNVDIGEAMENSCLLIDEVTLKAKGGTE